ncbi:MAG: thioredoxin family protein [Cyclobacteriaceae bacterium]|nr:thioredoxin family protein [Cyclobacteriaceae bacterium]
MSLTPSSMLELKTRAIEFELPDVISGNVIGLTNLSIGKKGLLVMFICNHCPYVKHVQSELLKISEDYMSRDIALVAISSNDAENYPEDGPELMLEEAKKWSYPFPYLYDKTQAVAKAYKATCTPDFFLFDKSMELVYRGELDESRPGNGKELNGNSLRTALDNLLAGVPIDENQKPSVGCNIKWKY